MAKYSFTRVGNLLIAELVPVLTDVQPRTMSFNQPSTQLVSNNTKIKIFDSGIFKKSFLFSEIGTIASATPTTLKDANDKLTTLIGALAPSV